MAGLKFRIEADVQKVIELRTEIKKLETALRYMQESTSSTNFKNLVKELNSNREELVKVIESAKNAGAALNQNLGTGTAGAVQGMDKLSEAIRVYNIEEKKLGQNVRDLKMDQRGTDKQSEEYKKMAATIVELQKEQNRYKDLLFQLREEKKRVSIENKNAIVSEKELDSIIKNGAKSIAEANEQNRRLRQTVRQIKDGDVEATAQRHKYNEVINRNTEYVRRNSDAMARQKMDVGGYKQAINDAWVSIKNGSNSMKNMGIIASNTGGMLKSKLASGMNSVQNSVGSMIKGFVGAQAIVTGIRKAIGFIQSGIISVVDFEQINSNLQAILKTTKDGIKDLEFDAKRLGAVTRYTASEVTGLQLELAKAGFKQTDILNSTESILKFAQATGATLSNAASLAGSSLMAFNASTQDTGRYVSAMAVATTNSALNFEFLNSAMSTVAPVANAYNFSIEDTIALLGNLADAGFDASSSATATRNILLNLADSNGKLAKALGGSVGTLPELVKGLKELNEKGIDLAETLELTDKRSVSAFNTFLNGADKILSLRDSITNVKGELDTMASTMDDNVRGAIAGLSSAWEAFMLSFSKSTGPAKSVIEFFTRGIRNITSILNSDEDNQAIRNADAISGVQATMDEYNVLEKAKERVKELYDENVKNGMSADNAMLKAKDSFLKKYYEQLTKENNLYKKLMDEKNKTIDKANNASFFKQAIFLEKTNNQYKAQVKGMEGGIAGLMAERHRTTSIIDAVEGMDAPKKEVKKETKLTDKQKKELEKQLKAEKKLKEDRAKVVLSLEDKNQKESLDLMADGFDKRLALIEYSYGKELKEIEKMRKEANLSMGDERVQTALANADDQREKEKEALYKSIENKYKTHEENLLVLNKKYDDERRILEERGNKEGVKELEKARKKEIKELHKPLDINLDEILGDIVKYSPSKLKRLRRELGDILKSVSKDLDPVNFKVLSDALKDIDNNLLVKDSFGELKKSLNDYKKTTDEVIKATEEYNNVKGNKEEEIKKEKALTEVIEAQAEARYELGRAINAVARDGQDFVAMGTAFATMLSDLGVKVPKNINDILGGAGKVFDSLANIDVTKPMSIVTSAFGIIGGLGKMVGGIGKTIAGIFGSGRKAKKQNREMLEIIRLQNLELERQYAIQKAQEEVKKQQTIFGKNEWASNKALADSYAEQREALNNVIAELNKGEVVTGSYVSKSFWRSKRKDTWSGILDGYPQLIKASGEFDTQLAESILNTKKLDDAGKELLTKAIEESKELEGIYEQMSNSLEGIFGSLGDSIMDSFVDAFKGGADAMGGVYKSAGQMIESLAKQMIYSATFGTIMKNAQDQMMSVQKDLGLSDEDKYSKFTSIISNTLDGVKAGSDQAMGLIKWAQDESKRLGVDIFKDSEVQTSKGRGFETMSQDTASSLDGRFTAIHEIVKLFRDDFNKVKGNIYQSSFDMMLQVQSKTMAIADEIRTIAVNSYLELQGIRENTGAIIKPINEMVDTLDRIDRNTKNLAE